MFRYAFENHEPNKKYDVISNSFSVWTLGFVIYSAIFLMMHNALRFEFSGLIFLYGIAVAIQYQYLYIARAFLRNKLFVVSGLTNSLISAIINILLILKFNMGIESLYIAPILGCIAQILMIEIILHPLKHFHLHDIKIRKIVEMLRFSVPLCIATVLYWLLTGYTKIVISQQLGTYANGLYAVANRFSSMMTLLITVFQYAWNEMAYFMAEEDNRSAQYEKSVNYIFRIMILGSGIFMLFTKLVFPYFIDSAYRDALMIVPLSLIGIAINAFAGFIDTIFMAVKQTRWIFKTTIIGAGINIAALWIFTPIFKLQGAIGALCFAFTVLILFRIYVLEKVFSIKFKLSNYLYFFMLAIVVCVFYAVDNTLWLVVIMILLGGISVYCLRDILIPLLGVLHKKGEDEYYDFKTVKNFNRRKSKRRSSYRKVSKDGTDGWQEF
jgi:O-antigen/teichoic acid export membrane protein